MIQLCMDHQCMPVRKLLRGRTESRGRARENSPWSSHMAGNSAYSYLQLAFIIKLDNLLAIG